MNPLFRHDPDSPENQAATQDNRRAVFAAKMEVPTDNATWEDLIARNVNLERELGEAESAKGYMHGRFQIMEQQVIHLKDEIADAVETLKFIRDECDWEPVWSVTGGGGDKRIGPACDKILGVKEESKCS